MTTGPGTSAQADATASARQSAACSTPSPGLAHPSRIGGIARPQHVRAARCPSRNVIRPTSSSGDPAIDGVTPPLLDGGGEVMATPALSSQVTVTPIFWAPTGYGYGANYRSIIERYLTDLAAASGTTSNVFATLPQYTGSNGRISYHVVRGASITDAQTFPQNSENCTLTAGPVYSNGAGNTVCLADSQIVTEVNRVVAQNHLPSDLTHIYVVFTARRVESCFGDGGAGDSCSLNPSSTGAYCGYHSFANTTIYADMPYPVYGQEGTSNTCSPEFLTGTTEFQLPNGDTDADSEISILSHETAESITDPVPPGGWADSTGNENGDECSFVFGTLGGTDGAMYNQTINGNHYLTQEEFSNDDYVPNVSGCVQDDPPSAPVVRRVSANVGPTSGGQPVTITGGDFTGVTGVTFSGTPATHVRARSGTLLTALAPAHAAGTVHVYVTNATGSSPRDAGSLYHYVAAPVVSRVSPNSGPVAGRQSVVITGTDFTGATRVAFRTSTATILARTATQLTVSTPARAAGPVNVYVTAPGGTSRAVAADVYTYRPVPRVTRVSPTSGSHAGGRSVTLTGTGFTGTTRVRFGSTSARFTVVSSTSLRVTTPVHAAGYVNIYVTTSGGRSAPVSGDVYRFL